MHGRPSTARPVASLTMVFLLAACAATTTPTQTPASPGTAVSVVVSALAGANGKELAGVLTEPGAPGKGLASLSVRVDADPFATTQVMRRAPQPPPEDVTSFPYATGEAANVPAGTYSVYLYVGRDLFAYGPGGWVPGSSSELPLDFACSVHVTKLDGQDAIVRVTSVPRYDSKVEIRVCPAP
jgi:hypothetical protein